MVLQLPQHPHHPGQPANHSTAAGHVTTVLTSDWLQEFLLKYSNLIADAKAMQCSECECSVLLLDFKEMCTRDRADGMIWVGCVLYCTVLYCTAPYCTEPETGRTA